VASAEFSHNLLTLTVYFFDRFHVHLKMSNTSESNVESRIYPYSPLSESDEIRLLLLQPHIPGQRIKCTIQHVKLSEKPRYEALSYMWGPKNMKFIEIDDYLVDVRENLWAALCQLAPPNGIRVLWIDAVCIDQNNVEERNHQVAQMGRIYTEAKQVAVWLGESDENSSIVFEFLGNTLQWKRLQDSLAGRSRAVRAFYTFCCRDYWSRLWIIQELVLAAKIYLYCGDRSCSWSCMPWFLDVLENHRPPWIRELENSSALHSSRDTRITVRAIKTTFPLRILAQRELYIKQQSQKYRLETEQAHPLFILCQEYGEARCEDRRDKVFGLSGIAMDCCKIATPVDYSSTWGQVCQSVLLHFFQHHYKSRSKRRDFIYQAQRFHERLRIISKDLTCQTNTLIKGQRLVSNHFRIVGYIRGRISWVSPALNKEHPTPGTGILSFTNMNVLSMNYTGEILYKDGYTPDSSVNSELDLVESIMKGNYPPFPSITSTHQGSPSGLQSGNPKATKFLSSQSCMTRSIHQILSSAREGILRTKSYFGSVPSPAEPETTPFDLRETKDLPTVSHGTHEDMSRILTEARKAAPSNWCSLAVERNGLICFVPPDTQPGDLICQFHNSDVLAILRPDIYDESYQRVQVGGRAVNFLKARSKWPSSIASFSSVNIGNQLFSQNREVELDLNVEALHILTSVSATPNPRPRKHSIN
jgi:hypothetical protein